MKTILCPVDSSSRTEKLLHYLVDLAKDTQSKICLVEMRAAQKSLVEAGGGTGRSHSRLDELHDYISGIKHVACGLVEESVPENAFKKLGTIADDYDLMAVPINGKANNNLTKILLETLVPLLLIPDRFAYKKVTHLLYAYDYKHEPEPPLVQLHWLAEWFGAEVRFISVLPSDISAKEADRLNAIRNAIGAAWKGKYKISFETIIYPDVPRCLEQYVNLRGANDLLVLSINHQNVLQRLWHKSVVKGLMRYGKHPYLVIHR